ncbi:MAG: HlyD family secretion protein [Sediminibacterium sp.]|jgi:multidrug resistance efflux pump|nr:HlyD family secretion protein [Sediminibacterium sp.]
MKKTLENMNRESNFTPTSVRSIYRYDRNSKVGYWVLGVFGFLLILLFLPWTQNISSSGHVTTLYQDQRPQQINTVIPGKIVKWYIKEGDVVKKGDTIVELADVKDDYLDTNLVARTRDQLVAKEQKLLFYSEKINAIESQINAIENNRNLKINSLENKIEQFKRKLISDSSEVIAAEVDYKISQEQLTRGKQLFNQGVVSLVELERRTAQNNKALAILTEKQQKLLNTRQDINIVKIDINSARQEADDKIFKSRSEIATSRGEIAGTTGDMAKNRNILANYISRGNQKWLIAPQDGQIIKAKKSGINEIVKEGEMIVEMVPTQIDFAIELFVEPMDLILINRGQKVRMIFDGFPAIVFSGWPNNSYGTFGGEISMVENNRNENGKFRILVIPDSDQKGWPKELKTGTGARGFALLNTVPIWYELWRQINGFPPDYYKTKEPTKKEK